MSENHKSIFEKALQNLNHPLSSHLDENVKIMFKGFGKEATEFQTKLKKFGFDKEYRKMMQNFKKNANPGDGLFFIEEIPSDDERKRTKVGDSMELEVLPVDGNYYNLKKLGDSDEQKRGGKVYKSRLIAIKEDVQLDEGSEIVFSFDNPMKAGAFASRIMRDKLASEVDRYVSGRKEMVQIIMHPNDYERNDIEKLAKQYKGQLREERAMTYVIDRKTKKIVHGPTDTGDAKLYLKKQIQPRKFMIRQIRGAAKKVGDLA